MRASVVITFAGVDRQGLVEELSEVVAAHGGNWELSRLAHLAGHFAGVVEVTIDDDRLVDLDRALAGVDELDVQVRQGVNRPVPVPQSMLRLELTGADHPGLLHDVARVLYRHGLNVEDLATSTLHAPMAGGTVFRVRARLSAPADLDLHDVRESLEGLGDDLQVELGPATAA